MQDTKAQDKLPDLGWATVKQVAQHFSCSVDLIWRMSRDRENGFPAPYKLVARCTRWNVQEILEWEASLRSGTATIKEAA
ncbi:helix-turn-helix transcriptional regulator [Roseovarius sp.]|uniref:helix-turn-helix transcriptional regulator n=1 Tax=Roseovarius sp. TaxID=1486281 RepID=UPI003BACC02B